VRVLLDENLSHLLRHSMPKHEVVTVRYMGWGGLKNGILIAAAEDDGIEVFVTGDQNLSYQHTTGQSSGTTFKRLPKQ